MRKVDEAKSAFNTLHYVLGFKVLMHYSNAMKLLCQLVYFSPAGPIYNRFNMTSIAHHSEVVGSLHQLKMPSHRPRIRTSILSFSYAPQHCRVM